ncbi:response regulator, partial [Limosilactobacillus mucosae]|nr:response regulator [Limosilactobacillus mucosae]
MNFYIADDDPDTIALLSDLIENDFNNSIVGVADNPQQAYDDLLRLRVDIMLVDYGMPVMTGIQLIEKLKAANSQPHFIMMSSVSDAKTRTAAYQAGIDFFLEKPINLAETKHIIRLIASYTLMTDKLNRIFELVGSSAPYHLPQSQQRQQVDRIKSILRFLGITAETGSQDIIRIISLMVDQK